MAHSGNTVRKPGIFRGDADRTGCRSSIQRPRSGGGPIRRGCERGIRHRALGTRERGWQIDPLGTKRDGGGQRGGRSGRQREWSWNDWTGDVLTFSETDMEPMYKDQYVIRAVAPRPPSTFPLAVSIGRFIVDDIGFEQVIIVPIVDATETELVLDFCNAFELKDYP